MSTDTWLCEIVCLCTPCAALVRSVHVHNVVLYDVVWWNVCLELSRALSQMCYTVIQLSNHRPSSSTEPVFSVLKVRSEVWRALGNLVPRLDDWVIASHILHHLASLSISKYMKDYESTKSRKPVVNRCMRAKKGKKGYSQSIGIEIAVENSNRLVK
jgi:hypothetical protein